MRRIHLVYIVYIIASIIIMLAPGIIGAAAEPQQKPLSDKDCQQILAEMSRKLSTNTTLNARFVQERHLVMFGDVLRSEGYIYYQQPGNIRWEFTKPYGSITIMLENGSVEKYDVIDGKTVKVKTGSQQVLGEVLTQIASWQKGDFSQAAEDFDIQMYKGKTYKLVMKPLSKGLGKILSRLEFEIDRQSFLVHSVCLWEEGDDFTLIRFHEQRINETLSAGLFNIKDDAQKSPK